MNANDVLRGYELHTAEGGRLTEEEAVIVAALKLKAAAEANDGTTPETDASLIPGEHDERGTIECVEADFARRIERERNGLAARVRELEASKDAAYLERNRLVAFLATIYPGGIKKTAIEGWSEDWHGCVYIDFPWGQASWHYHDSHAYLFNNLPPYAGAWDGHTTEQKYAAIDAARSKP